jgi:ferredoxin-NADP reductase
MAADLKVGTIVRRQRLSPILEIFDLAPEENSRFPKYQPGQYIALRRDQCRLTKEVVGKDGRKRYVPDLDTSGNPKLGPVTHSYSIASAPFESQERGHLEFYVVLEQDSDGTLGRLSSSFLEVDSPPNDKITYVNRITGNFTLAKTANDFTSVLLVGTGTGLAPFVSMIKQIHFDASQGRSANGVRYTLVHTNRTYEELAYHQELLAIEKSQLFDFVYVPSVSRPTERDINDPRLGRGRANNVLRHMFGMPLKEEQELQIRIDRGADTTRAKAYLDKATPPVLPKHLTRDELQKRFAPSTTVILTCGNPSGMEDIHFIADANHIKFEKEDW